MQYRTTSVASGAALIALCALSSPAHAQSTSPAISAIPSGTTIAVRTLDPIDSNEQADKEYRATIDDAVIVGTSTIAPVGAPAFLRVVRLEQAGAVRGRAAVTLRLASLEVDGQQVPVETGDATIRSGSQGGKAAKAGVGGAIAGGILGGLLGGKGGAATGVAVGTAAGVTAAAVSGQRVRVPAETRLSFTLTGEAVMHGATPASAASEPPGQTAGAALTSTNPRFARNEASTDAPAPVSAASPIPPNTVIAIRTIDPIDSEVSPSSKEFRATVDDAIVVAGTTVAPIGTPAILNVVQVQQAGAVRGRSTLGLRLVAIDLNGQRVPLETGEATIRSGSQGAKATKAGAGGAIVGGIIGGLLGGGGAAAQGAAAGAAVGVTAAAISGQKVHVPAETRLSFTVTGAPDR